MNHNTKHFNFAVMAFLIAASTVLALGWYPNHQENTSLREPERIEMHQQRKRYNIKYYDTGCDGDVWYSVPCNCNFEG